VKYSQLHNLSDTSINYNNHRNTKNGSINQFIVFRQPIGKENIEVGLGGVRVLSVNNRKRTKHSKSQQNQAFQQNNGYADPDPFVNFIGDGGV
tara:strand:+ start:211 stop:489 length:279 start_codon:yes stop_codon:yes gene_type:complete